jgi:hypothetical protein
MRRLPARVVLGCLLAVAGAVALFLGWYGVSGTPLTAKQVPYLISGGLSGVCLVLLAAACFATDDVRRSLSRVESLEQKVDQLYSLLTESDLPADDDALVALERGSAYHRASCRLVVGKSARPLDSGVAAARSLVPCRLCDPPGLRVA